VMRLGVCVCVRVCVCARLSTRHKSSALLTAVNTLREIQQLILQVDVVSKP